jgi:meiotically up-regulated gene 157 (Mug157) protein
MLCVVEGTVVLTGARCLLRSPCLRVVTVMKLSTQYYNLTKDATPFKADWVNAMGVIVNIITEMQEVHATTLLGPSTTANTRSLCARVLSGRDRMRSRRRLATSSSVRPSSRPTPSCTARALQHEGRA